MKFQYDVYYCGECGSINNECLYNSDVTEWGYITLGRYGTDYNQRDSDTQETRIKCDNCNEEFSDVDTDGMPYKDALAKKMEDYGRDEMDESEREDYDEFFGEHEPPEPREGRNTLKCPEEAV